MTAKFCPSSSAHSLFNNSLRYWSQMCSAAVIFGCCWALEALVRWRRVRDVRAAARFQASQNSLLLSSVDGPRTEQSDRAFTRQILSAAPSQRHSLLKSLTKKSAGSAKFSKSGIWRQGFKPGVIEPDQSPHPFYFKLLFQQLKYTSCCGF